MAYVTRGYILESDIGEGPLFPNDKAPVGLDFNQLVRVANEAKQQHLRLAETYTKQECSVEFLEMFDCVKSRRMLTSFCRPERDAHLHCINDHENRLKQKVAEWTRDNIVKYGGDMRALTRNKTSGTSYLNCYSSPSTLSLFLSFPRPPPPPTLDTK